MRCYVTVHNTPLSLKREREVVIGTKGNGVTDVMPCRHHWLLDPSDEVCSCGAIPEAHYHGACQKCGATATWLAVVESSYIEKMQGLAVMMGVHTWDEAPKGGAV